MPADIRPANMTINEFATWARVGRTKIYELINTGELRAIKVGRNTLIPIESADEWLASRPAYVPMRKRAA